MILLRLNPSLVRLRQPSTLKRIGKSLGSCFLLASKMKQRSMFNKSPSDFYASALLLMINCVITSSKWLWNHKPQASGCAVNFDSVIAKFISNKRTSLKSWRQFVCKRRLNLAENKVNFIRNDANIVNSFPRILMCYLKKSIKSH